MRFDTLKKIERKHCTVDDHKMVDGKIKFKKTTQRPKGISQSDHVDATIALP